MKQGHHSFLAAAAAAIAVACSDGEVAQADEPAPTEDAVIRGVLALDPRLAVPAFPEFNPPTLEKVELGRRLFYEKALSGNGTQSCGTCHKQSLGFTDGKRLPTGSTGQVHHRNSQGLQNVAYYSTLTWANDGLIDFESQIQVPIRGDNPVELGVSDGLRDEVLERFDADPGYREAFAAAFPESGTGSTIEKVAFALATFCRTLISADSPYDRYIRGNRTALTDPQRRGLALFNGERFECFHCHTGTNLTTSYRDQASDPGSTRRPFFNNGLYNVDGNGSYPSFDQGLYDLTLDPNDRGLFRPPSLRNVALTGPYMHDGSIEALRDVVKHYAAGGRVLDASDYAGDGRTSPLKSGLVRGFQVTEQELDDVVAFLGSLTDESFITNPRFSDPSGPM